MRLLGLTGISYTSSLLTYVNDDGKQKLVGSTDEI